MASKLEQEINKLDKDQLRAELKKVIPDAAAINAENIKLLKANEILHEKIQCLEADLADAESKLKAKPEIILPH